MSVHRRLTLAAILVSCAASLATASGMFATATWLNPGTGNWDTGANWSTAAEPTAADDALVNNGGTVQITSAANTALSLVVGSAGGASGTVIVAGGALSVEDVRLANDGTGTLTIESGGSVTQTGGAASSLEISDNGTGTISVDGAGSILDWTGGFAVLGSNSASATVNLTNDGELSKTDGLTLGSGGGSGTINVGTGGVPGVLTANVHGEAGAASSTIHFNHTGAVTHSHVMSGSIAVTKSGAGSLTLTGANTYTGGTTLNEGTLAGNSGSLRGDIATSSSTIVTFDQTVDGTYAGVISGPGRLTKQGAGTLTLTGVNTHALTIVETGTLRAGAANVFPPSLMQPTATGTLDLNGHDQTVGALHGDGSVTLGSASLTFGSESGTFTGIISGTGTLSKIGPSTARLTGNNTYTGATTVTNGSLFIDGSQPSSAITLTGGTLLGTGTVGAITATGGRLAPGGSPGLLTSGDVSFNGSTTFVVEIDGAVPGSDYDVLVVNGTVALGGATLDITPGFSPAIGSEFTIISNDGADAVTGTFAGLDEGDSVAAGGTTFRISYAGDDGNDVTLRVVGTPAVEPGTLPDMTVGEPYSVTFTATGGVPPYTFAVSAGALPDGLTLDGATGELSGTPTTAGPFSFSITATDSSGGTDVQAYSGDVLPAPVPSMPMLGFLVMAALLGAMGYFRLRSGVA